MANKNYKWRRSIKYKISYLSISLHKKVYSYMYMISMN